MQWLVLIVGILFEVLGTVSMKYAEGFTKLVPSVLAFLFYLISLVMLIFVLEKMELGIAYAVWSSGGILLISLIGIVWFGEHISYTKIISIALIILGIFGLELFD